MLPCNVEGKACPPMPGILVASDEVFRFLFGFAGLPLPDLLSRADDPAAGMAMRVANLPGVVKSISTRRFSARPWPISKVSAVSSTCSRTVLVFFFTMQK